MQSYYANLSGAYGTMQSSGGLPSQKEVLASIATVTKESVLAYDVRVVETGALLKVREI
jgi:hypothetical protein